MSNYVNGIGRSLVYWWLSIPWNPSKFYGKNHLVIVLVNHHTAQSSKIIFNALLSDKLNMRSFSVIKREELTWHEKEVVAYESNVLPQLPDSTLDGLIKTLKQLLIVSSTLYLESTDSNWYTKKRLRKIQNIANFNMPLLVYFF